MNNKDNPISSDSIQSDLEKDALERYGAAEYRRGIDAASAIADRHAKDFASARMKEEWEVSVSIAELIRQLGETS